MNPIIAVLDDDDGSVNYRLKPTTRTTVEYGTILAQLAAHLAEMMHVESEGVINAAQAHGQIVGAFIATPVDLMANPPLLPH